MVFRIRRCKRRSCLISISLQFYYIASLNLRKNAQPFITDLFCKRNSYIHAQNKPIETYCWWFTTPAPVEVGKLSHYLRRVFYTSHPVDLLTWFVSINSMIWLKLNLVDITFPIINTSPLKIGPPNKNCPQFGKVFSSSFSKDHCDHHGTCYRYIGSMVRLVTLV